MTVKKLRYLAAALSVVAVSACQKDPDTSDLNDDYVVYTNYDTKQDFKQFSTFFIPDQILLINASEEQQYWTDADAQKIIATISAQMEADGYTPAAKDTADVGLQLTYIEDVTYFIDYDWPWWWWDYPYYWDPTYWGPWEGWYYPYVVYYSYTAGSLLTEMLNLTGRTEGGGDIPVVWSSYVSGLETGSEDYDTERIMDAVKQAFAQSPYLKIKNQ